MALVQVDVPKSSTQEPNTKRLAAQNMQLSGHQSEVLNAKFSPCGEFLASAGTDKLILVWDVYDP